MALGVPALTSYGLGVRVNKTPLTRPTPASTLSRTLATESSRS